MNDEIIIVSAGTNSNQTKAQRVQGFESSF